MKLILAAIGPRASSASAARGAGPRASAFDELVKLYHERLTAYIKTEIVTYRSAEALFDSLERHKARTASLLVLLDSRGKELSSEELAAWLGRIRDAGHQQVVFVVGPADGWSAADRERAYLLLSLGRMTLPHELARVVLSEQVYRAFTILAGHPYHTGH